MFITEPNNKDYQQNPIERGGGDGGIQGDIIKLESLEVLRSLKIRWWLYTTTATQASS